MLTFQISLTGYSVYLQLDEIREVSEVWWELGREVLILEGSAKMIHLNSAKGSKFYSTESVGT
jgi:hypothetical protein